MPSQAVSGLGEGAGFLGQTYLARLSSPGERTEIFGMWELGVAAGLIGGPTITSLSSSLADKDQATGEGGVWITAALAFLLLSATWGCFPSSTELTERAGYDAAERPCWHMDADMPEEKWVAVLVTSASTTVRLLSRLVWEASAVMVLTAHFCLGYSYSGYGASFVILFHLSAQAIFVKFCSWMTDHNLVRCCECIELCGLLLIFRLPRDLDKTIEDDIIHRESALVNIMIFLIGSGLFYAGNCLTSAPLNSWGTKRGPREACVLFYQNLAVQAGVCGGACLSRLFAGADPHQNTLVFVLLPTVLAQILLSEMGLGSCAPTSEPGSLRPRVCPASGIAADLAAGAQATPTSAPALVAGQTAPGF